MVSNTAREKIFDRMRENAPYEVNEINDIINKYNRYTGWMNVASISTLIFGVICTLVFFIIQIL